MNDQFWFWQTKACQLSSMYWAKITCHFNFIFYYLVILDHPMLNNDTDVNISNLWQIQANLWKYIILNITRFPDPTFQNGFGKDIYQEFSVLRSLFPYEDIYLSLNNLLCYIHSNAGCFQIATKVRWTFIIAAFISHRRHFLGSTFWEWPQGCRVWITIRCYHTS